MRKAFARVNDRYVIEQLAELLRYMPEHIDIGLTVIKNHDQS